MSKAMIETVTRMVLLAELIPDPEHLARHTPERVKQLAADLAANGLHQAIGVLAGQRIIFGHGRYAAAKSLGWKEIEAKVYPATLSETQWKVIRATENLQRTDLTGYEKWQLGLELLKLNPLWQGKDLAEHLSLDPSMVTRLLCPSKCIPAAQDALKQGKIGISTCYAISKCATPEEQAAMLAAALGGTSRDALERQGRKRRNGTVPAVKLSKVKIAMTGGVNLVISGKKGFGMSEIVELLADTLKAAKKAAEQYDVSTWTKMMADLAKG